MSGRMLLGLDIGTSGAKALALAGDGEVLATMRVQYSALDPSVRENEQDPALWLRALEQACRELGERVDLDQVEATSLCGQMHGLVAVDDAGQAVGPCRTWADARCTREAEELRQGLGDAIVASSGNGVLEAFTAPKLLWSARHEPATSDARACLPKDYVRMALTGTWSTDVSDATGTLLYDLRTNAWNPSLVAAAGWDIERLPPVRVSTSAAGPSTDRGSRICGIRRGTPVYTGGADVACAALGAGLLEPGKTYINVGTAAQLLTISEPRPDPARRFTFGHCVPDTYLAMGSLFSAGLSARWFIERMQPSGVPTAAGPGDYARFDALAEASPPGARGLLFLPYLSGASLPDADPDARGAFVGISPAHGTADFSRAIIEGVCLGIRFALEGLDPAGVSTSFVLGGGISVSETWPAVLANVLGRPVSVLRHDASPLGAAMLAGIGAGIFADPADAVARSVETQRTYEPNTAIARFYDRNYDAYVEMRQGLRPTFASLAALPGAAKEGS